MMPLARGKYIGSEFQTGVCHFTMLNGEAEVKFRASWECMDDLEGGEPALAHHKDEQFHRIRNQLENLAERKFFSFLDDDRPESILLTTADLD